MAEWQHAEPPSGRAWRDDMNKQSDDRASPACAAVRRWRSRRHQTADLVFVCKIKVRLTMQNTNTTFTVVGGQLPTRLARSHAMIGSA
jgi:hypothetical protein